MKNAFGGSIWLPYCKNISKSVLNMRKIQKSQLHSELHATEICHFFHFCNHLSIALHEEKMEFDISFSSYSKNATNYKYITSIFEPEIDFSCPRQKVNILLGCPMW